MKKIILKNISHHNLKNIDVEIPHNSFTVITGVSGSGKSSLAMDVLYRAAERAYLETYSIHTRQLLNKVQAPELEYISGLRPAIRLEQKNHINSPRATVATLSNLSDLLRLLFARFGKSGDSTLKINRSLFSFNKPEGACPVCKGLGFVERVQTEMLIADENKTLREGALVITTPSGYTVYSQVTIDVMNQVCNSEGFSVDIPWKNLTEKQKDIVLYGSNKIKILFGKHSLESRMKWKGITAKPREEGYYKGIIPVMEEILKRDRNKNILRFVKSQQCEACSGSRYNAKALSVKFHDKNIADLLALSIDELQLFFKKIKYSHQESQSLKAICNEILKQTKLLKDLGLAYLQLNREASNLSGSEAARIRLSTQINSRLRGVLYIFDEPAAGLHAADLSKILQQIIYLRDMGNTVVVVDHNEQIIRQADYIIELGPGAGRLGGKLLYQGKLPQWTHLYHKIPESKTAAFLSGKRNIQRQKNSGNGKYLKIYGAKSRNLKNINVIFHLNTITVITGLSGAGKSSLLKYTLANYLRKKLQKTNSSYGLFDKIEGVEHIDKLIEINQSPIGKTSRSNPATYTKVFDEIRSLYANLEDAKRLNFNKSHFSFNTKGGRCEHCEGAGYIQTGMHFLENIETVCPECNGKRFKKELLSVKYQNKNIYDILEMSIGEAYDFFINETKIRGYLSTLNSLGLSYLKLGQRSSTLSGGEAQRIKLAAELSRPSTGKTLYILDEPTRGLHLHDISILFKFLQKLIDKGNSIFVIEHNLHFIQNADFIIDLGIGSGIKGGNIIFNGKAEDLINIEDSLTGKFLKKLRNNKKQKQIEKTKTKTDSAIIFKGISSNNLKHIDIEIPLNKVVVFTGISGSGKSSLLYNTIYAESRKIFNESFSPYVRNQLGSIKQADFVYANGLSPVIVIEQKRLKANAHSTVGTLTEIYDFYRLLYARIGQLRFPEHKDNLTAAHFSFNQAQGWCKTCGGLGFIYQPDMEKVITDKSKSILAGAMDGNKTGKFYGNQDGQYIAILKTVGKIYNIDFSKAWKDLSEKERNIAFYGCGDEEFEIKWKFKRGKHEGVQEFKSRWIGFSGYIQEEYKRKEADKRAENLLVLMKKVVCNVCKGKRLNSTSLLVKIAKLDISSLSALSVKESIDFMQSAEKQMRGTEKAIFNSLSKEIIRRLQKIKALGLFYLSINQLSSTLSGGEAQRIRLAGMLGSRLSGITYILDEPSAGLHPSSNQKLIESLKELRDLGNTVLVSEHNVDIIRAADYLFELGKGAGIYGGEIIAQGNLREILNSEVSLTAKYIKDKKIPLLRSLKKSDKIALKIKNAHFNNLKNFNLDIFEGVLNVIHGKSGSGKSSLLNEIYYYFNNKNEYKSREKLINTAQFSYILFANQDLPSGKTNTTVASYTGIFDEISKLFIKSQSIKTNKLKKNYFSLHTSGSRCEHCKGVGYITISMDFLADIETVCEHCAGKRYKKEALQYTINGKNIADILGMSFQDLKNDKISDIFNEKIQILEKVGLDYLKLGQSLKTLSGGERQRIKLASELIKAKIGKKLYLFDEPSNGLHFEDVKKLISLFEELLLNGNTILLSEHHPFILKNADYLIELGPDGGKNGGELISLKWNN